MVVYSIFGREMIARRMIHVLQEKVHWQKIPLYQINYITFGYHLQAVVLHIKIPHRL